jgi:hypothetical protein
MRLRSFTEGEGGEGWCFIDGWIPLVSWKHGWKIPPFTLW